jgi:hypothetical protein
MKLRVSLKREIVLVLTLKRLYETYGQYFLDYYFRPSIMNYGVPTFIYPSKKFENLMLDEKMKKLSQRLVNPDTPSAQEKQEYEEILENALKRKFLRKPENLHEQYALVRYEILQVVFGGLGWSVLPEEKKKWKIDQEMFGAYFNTNLPFCSLFPELEGTGEQFGTVVPKPNIHYLINPPFEKYYIRWTCERILEWLSEAGLSNLHFTIIIPVWDEESRKKLKLKPQAPMPQLSKLLQSKFVKQHTMTKMKVWDSVSDKVQHQQSYIHKIVIVK